MSILINLEKDFSPRQTFTCGQCFRWKENADGSFTGVAGGRVAHILYDGKNIEIKGAKEDDRIFWEEYLDIKRDYSAIKKRISKTPAITQAVEYGSGIRILKQEFFETLLSFIISQRSSIPKIQGSVEKLASAFGKNLGDGYFAFPSAKELKGVTEKDYLSFGVGYRAKYLKKAVDGVLSGDISEEALRGMETHEARENLLKIFGVGNKVADCILLFGLSRYDSFPVDVWVKRAMDKYFDGQDGFVLFGEDSGFAQQYIFYKMRSEG